VSKYFGADLVNNVNQWHYRNMVFTNQYKYSRHEHLHLYAIGRNMRINGDHDNHSK
jgi:hypothetical protein